MFIFVFVFVSVFVYIFISYTTVVIVPIRKPFEEYILLHTSPFDSPFTLRLTDCLCNALPAPEGKHNCSGYLDSSFPRKFTSSAEKSAPEK